MPEGDTVMKFISHLYVSESMEKKKEKTIRRLKGKRLQRPVSLLAFFGVEGRHLEIVSSVEVLQPSYPRELLLIAGLARDYDDALDLVQEIVQEAYDETGEISLYDYIMGRELEG